MYTPHKHRRTEKHISKHADLTKNGHMYIKLVLYRGYMEDSSTLAHISYVRTGVTSDVPGLQLIHTH